MLVDLVPVGHRNHPLKQVGRSAEDGRTPKYAMLTPSVSCIQNYFGLETGTVGKVGAS